MMALSFLAVPVFLETTTDAKQLLFQWVRMYHYGHQIMPTMAISTFLLHLYTCYERSKAQKSWAIFGLASAATIIMLPFTWFVMAPTNNQLFLLESASKTGPSVAGIAEVKALVVRWAWMHVWRSLMPLTGVVLATLGTFSSVAL